MVALIRDIRNKFFSTSANTNSASRMTLPTDMGIDIDNFISNIADNYDEVRGHTITYNKQVSRTVSMSSSEALVVYTTKMKRLNNCLKDKDLREPIDKSQLLYVTPRKQGNQVRVVADPTNNTREQYVPIEGLALNISCSSNKNMFNMQLPYDINQALDPKSWDSNFHAISLHGSMEYLVSDVKYIKKSLRRMQKYILNKSIKDNKANDIKNLEGVREVA